MTDDLPRSTFHGFEQIPLREYAERAYLDYSMYVVLDRALPFLGDGCRSRPRRGPARPGRCRVGQPSRPLAGALGRQSTGLAGTLVGAGPLAATRAALAGRFVHAAMVQARDETHARPQITVDSPGALLENARLTTGPGGGIGRRTSFRY